MKAWILILVLFLPTAAFASTQRFAIIVGNNEGATSKPALRYAEQDARNLYRVLTELGGFSPKNTNLLLGKSAETILNSVKTMKNRIARLPKSARDDVLFLFYFSGHTEASQFELASSFLEYEDLSRSLQKLPVTTRIVILDTCEGGYLIQSKGGTLIPPLSLPTSQSGLPRGDILISSSTNLEEALETSEFQGSLFTHYFILGLTGEADYNLDHRVSLNEVLSYASQQTAMKAASLKRRQQPTYGYNLTGSGEIYLTELRNGWAGSEKFKFQEQHRQIIEPTTSSRSTTVPLREGELIRLNLAEQISSKTNHTGDKVRLASAEDVFVNNRLVIAAGAPASGEILAIRKKRGLVHGELVCRLGYVQAVDGQWVPLNSIISRNPTGIHEIPEDKAEAPLSEIGSNTETDFASGMTAFFLLPLYPFLRGRDITLKPGTSFDAYVARDITIHSY